MLRKLSRIEFRAGLHQPTQCSYWDYYVDDRRLADVLKISDSIPPFGWLSPHHEGRFAEMLLGSHGSDLQPHRFPLYVCPLCADYGCGVFTCEIVRSEQTVEWRDFALQYPVVDETHREDAQRWIRYVFDAAQYECAFSRFEVGEKRRVGKMQ